MMRNRRLIIGYIHVRVRNADEYNTIQNIG